MAKRTDCIKCGESVANTYLKRHMAKCKGTNDMIETIETNDEIDDIDEILLNLELQDIPEAAPPAAAAEAAPPAAAAEAAPPAAAAEVVQGIGLMSVLIVGALVVIVAVGMFIFGKGGTNE